MHILIDTRERVPLKLNIGGVKTQRVKLDTGDYTLKGKEDVVVIERKKSVAEFATNVVEARYADWTERLSNIPNAYIVCEFSLEDVYSYPKGSGIPRRKWKYLRVKPAFILKKIHGLEELGIKFVYAGDRVGAEISVLNILKAFS